MVANLRFKRFARQAASGWAKEAIEMFGHNAERVIAEQLAVHRYPERYSFEFCLKEIKRCRRSEACPSPSLLSRTLAAFRDRRPPTEAAL